MNFAVRVVRLVASADFSGGYEVATPLVAGLVATFTWVIGEHTTPRSTLCSVLIPTHTHRFALTHP